MNKKVLVSILAMTSASTMTAWADANVKELKNDSLQNWGVNSEDTKLTLVDGVITSPDGTPISQKIKLAPGTYRFNYVATSTNNVTVKVDSTHITKLGYFASKESPLSESCEKMLMNVQGLSELNATVVCSEFPDKQ